MIDSVEVLPERLAEVVSLRLASSRSFLCAFWIRVKGDRSEYASRLRVAVGDKAVAVFVVRNASFNNPNSVAADVVSILNANRSDIENLFKETGRPSGLAVVMLGRTELALAQSSSPVTVPEWFPVAAGETVDVVIEDLTWSADGPLNCAEVRLSELNEAIYQLEEALIRRLIAVNAVDHNSGNAFMDEIRGEPTEKYGELLLRFLDTHNSVVNASGFRPSLKESDSLVARLWGIVQKRSPESLLKAGKALARAINFDSDVEIISESLSAVLGRPSSLDSSVNARFARDVLATVASSCQYVTAAAHSDYYSRYPIPLLVSFTYDLRTCLWRAGHMLRVASTTGN
jgi:hypothetical protein